MAKKGRAAIKKQLTAQLEQAGRLDAVTRDLVAEYLDARDRLEAAKAAYADANDDRMTVAPDRLEFYQRQIARETGNLAKLAEMLGTTPCSAKRASIKAELEAQLLAKDLKGPVFDDYVQRFMMLWDAFQEAVKCLHERGRSYMTTASTGKIYEKDNSAVKDMVSLSRAMKEVLEVLEITVEGYADADDDEL